MGRTPRLPALANADVVAHAADGCCCTLAAVAAPADGRPPGVDAPATVGTSTAARAHAHVFRTSDLTVSQLAATHQNRPRRALFIVSSSSSYESKPQYAPISRVEGAPHGCRCSSSNWRCCSRSSSSGW